MRSIAALALAAVASGCAWGGAFWQTTRDVAIKGGPPAVVAVAATPLGPLIQGASVLATVVITDLMTEKSALLSGEKIGSGALNREMERWERDWKTTKRALNVADESADFYRRHRWKLAWIVIGYIAFLRRQWIWKTITGQGVKSRIWTLIHTLLAGNWTREKAIGWDPIPKSVEPAPPVPVAVPAAFSPRRRRAKAAVSRRRTKRRKAIHA